MNKNITISVQPGEENNAELIKRKAAETLSADGKMVRPGDIAALIFRKKSIDARRGRIRINLMYTVWIGENPPANDGAPGGAFEPRWKNADSGKRVVIVGSGPAGLFAALRLIENGITPIVIERGSDTSSRKRDIAAITRDQKIDGESNYCFGEGGAGTFSDGKLYSRSNKRGDIGRILSIFNWHGADAAILTDAHPHIGTDKLPGIITRIRETITGHGGEIHFGTRCTGLVLEPESAASPGADKPRITGIVTAAGETIQADAVILATGHSARDIYMMLSDLQPKLCTPALEAKTFAVGVRVEHPKEVIDRIQYHGREREDGLPAAEYKLVAQVDGRGVYSFCMCPGGLIVPSATSDEEIVVNGMSTSGRNGQWSNAAIVVEVRPEDIPEEFREDAKNAAGNGADPGDCLAGLRFREWIEREAKRQGNGQRAPAQKLADFLAKKDSAALPPCSYSPGIIPSRLDKWLPEHIANRLAAAFPEFNKNMKGFVCADAVLVAPETRTSSPVRILRDGETCESPAIAGLYPAGEGAGYAGGIVSSAMDGERCADAVIAAMTAHGA